MTRNGLATDQSMSLRTMRGSQGFSRGQSDTPHPVAPGISRRRSAGPGALAESVGRGVAAEGGQREAHRDDEERVGGRPGAALAKHEGGAGIFPRTKQYTSAGGPSH